MSEEELNIWVMDDIHLHYHHVLTPDRSRICIDVIQFGGQVYMASWYGAGPRSCGNVNFKNEKGGR